MVTMNLRTFLQPRQTNRVSWSDQRPTYTHPHVQAKSAAGRPVTFMHPAKLLILSTTYNYHTAPFYVISHPRPHTFGVGVGE